MYFFFQLHAYIPWWFRCSSAISAPYSDLMLLKTLHQLKQIDLIIASSAMKELQLNFWYLTEEMVPLCLFDGCAANDEK